MLNRMRLQVVVAAFVPLMMIGTGWAQSATPSFEVASVRPSQHAVGPDYNNQIAYSGDRFVAKNVTLKRLIAEAWHLQMNQVSGPAWIGRNEYDVEARVSAGADGEKVHLMLRGFLAERFHLKEQNETREMRTYELTVGKGGAKVQPVKDGKTGAAAGPGLHFHGDMREFADLLAVQFSIPAAPPDPGTPVRAGGTMIPVLDKTGLQGIYDFSADVRPEPGTDAFTAWKRVLENQLGLEIESKKADVPLLVVDDADKVPTAN
ncbi:TIGR03435 family protein [Occallatibacter savannae]|uniref:TIGR03435 family protein n=1 Tax=Occallatibacter savannae TaxID=1002691 RepID=UPI000D687BEB|nr:TIGR03435 family protein [Occallatibacter savannae]